MGILAAFGHGFASFFSIWQVCILQISPFFLAFITGLYFLGYSNGGAPAMGRRMALPSAFFAVGFCVFYALSSVSGLPAGRFLSYNNGVLSIISGIYILFISIFVLLGARVALLGRLDRPWFLCAAPLILGISFAIVYSPCITPALSEIMGMTTRPETAVRGGVLALFYSLGIVAGLGLSAAVLILALRRIGAVTRNRGWLIGACGLILMFLGVMNVSGTMVYYKAFFLGLLVA